MSQVLDLTAGDWIVQDAANSTVGQYIVQIARARGIKTINVVRNDEAANHLRKLGGDVVAIEGPKLVATVREAVKNAPIRLAIDVGGPISDVLADLLAENGTLVVYGALAQQPVHVSPIRYITKNIQVRGFWITRWLKSAPIEKIRRLITSLDQAISKGALKTEISSVYPLTRIGRRVAQSARNNLHSSSLNGPPGDCGVTPAHRSEEVDATRTMIERVERQFDLTPKRLVADTAYGAAPMLNWIVNEKKIEPHIPVWEKPLREDGTFSRPDFQFDERTNTYECPGGKKLTRTGRPTNAGTVLFRALQRDCGSCALKQKCCPNISHRKIARSIYEDARDVARTVCATSAYEQSHKQRKKEEMLFAHLKRILKLDRLRLRGISGARDEFLMAAAAQNLRRMARWLTPATV